MQSLYQSDLAYIHATAFEELARGAADEIIRRLRNSKHPVRKVLDAGCGAGPLAKALLEAGFDVTGVDTSSELVALARRNIPQARFVHGSLYDVDLGGYDAVLAVGEPLTYHAQLEDADNVVAGFFQRVAQALPAYGMLIFDVIGLGAPSLEGRTWRSGDDWAVMVETSENQQAKALVRKIEVFREVGNSYRRSHEVHTVRLFDVPDLCRQLSSLGFDTEVKQAYGAQQLSPRRNAIFATRRAAT